MSRFSVQILIILFRFISRSQCVTVYDSVIYFDIHYFNIWHEYVCFCYDNTQICDALHPDKDHEDKPPRSRHGQSVQLIPYKFAFEICLV